MSNRPSELIAQLLSWAEDHPKPGSLDELLVKAACELTRLTVTSHSGKVAPLTKEANMDTLNALRTAANELATLAAMLAPGTEAYRYANQAADAASAALTKAEREDAGRA